MYARVLNDDQIVAQIAQTRVVESALEKNRRVDRHLSGLIEKQSHVNRVLVVGSVVVCVFVAAVVAVAFMAIAAIRAFIVVVIDAFVVIKCGESVVN